MGWLWRLLSSLGRPTEPEEWSVQVGDEGGAAVILRTRQRPPVGMRGEDYPASVAMVWRFEDTEHKGMPSPELTEQMSSFEDLLRPLEAPGSGLLAITITGNHRREWVWYATDQCAFLAAAQAIVTRAEVPVVVAPA